MSTKPLLPVQTTGYTVESVGAPELSHPRPERLEAGNPLRETWTAVTAPVGQASALSSGLWRCEPGRWRSEFGAHQQEVFTVLSGRCRAQGGRQGHRPGISAPQGLRRWGLGLSQAG